MKVKSDAVVALLFLLVAILYLSFLIGNELILCAGNQFFLEHPMRFVWLSHFFAGNLPWISNAVSGGIPLWADPNLAIFYPGNVLYLVLPLDQAWNVSLIFHLFWGAGAMYWLCRREFSLPVAASLTGAFTFLLSSSALGALNSSEVLITSSWLPWILGLVYSGLQQSIRRTMIASVALACQWLAGFTFVQAFTFLLVCITLVIVYLRARDRIVFLRFLLLIVSTLMIAAIQWIPAVLWIPHSNAELGFAQPDWKLLPYFGVISGSLFLIGLRDRVVWCALIVILVDWVLFGGSPVFATFLAMGAAIGAAQLFRKFHTPVLKLIPALVVVELLIANLQVPQMVSLSKIRKVPPEVTQIPELRRWNLHCAAARSGLSPLAGLQWGVNYGTPPDSGLMLWKPLPARKRKVEELLQTGKNLELLREAAIGFVISERLLNHPELRLLNQKATRFLVHRLTTPVYPLVKSSNPQTKLRSLEVAPHHLVIETDSSDPIDLIIHRNDLPGWECKMENKLIPIHTLEDGWMKIQAPAGKNRLSLTYRTPGSLVGTLLTALGTILILAVLLL
ncbi:YfhO family protein [bacterium]|nr:YfhO family protein [bacterium]